MQPHEKRVLKEYEELNEKSESLISFMNSDGFKNVDRVQSGLLYAQTHVMMAYRSILVSRLADFGIDVSEGDSNE